MPFEIKDRVAVGDNKYIMEQLEDGRVMLTPAPDSVEEEGTPLNRETLQPLFSQVVEINLFTPQTLASVVDNAEKIFVGNDIEYPWQEIGDLLMRGANVVLNYSFLDDVVHLTFEKRSNLNYVFSNTAESINGKPFVTVEFVYEIGHAHLLSAKSVLSDSVIEQGISGNWTYRKWASGIAECWCRKTSTETVEWDNSYVVCNVDFPLLFVTKPTINCSGHQQKTVSSYVAMVVSETNYASAYIKCQHEVNDEYACQFNFYVTGNWR